MDLALQVVFAANRHEHRPRIGLQLSAQFGDDAIEVRAGAVHFVDEGESGDAVAIGLAPDAFGLRLHPFHAAEDHDGAVEDAQRALHFGGEIDMARRVDDIDAMLLRIGTTGCPRGADGGGADGNALALLDVVEVHRRVAVVDVADLMNRAGVIEDALG